MDKDEAIELLKGGYDGVKEWNRRRAEGVELPSLRVAILSDAKLSHADFSSGDLRRWKT